MSSEVGLRIAKNSIFNVMRIFLTIPVLLIITPYIIRNIGREEFGIWALVGVLSSYAQLSDFGITESLIKFMAESKARNDIDGLNQLVNTAFLIYAIMSLVCCLIFLSILPFIIESILCIPMVLQTKTSHVFAIAIILFFINMLMGVFGSLIIGFQRMEYSNIISAISTVITVCGTFLFLHNGFGLTGLVYNNALVTCFVIVSNCVVARQLFPQLRINPFVYFNKSTLKRIFGFSWKVQITNITQLMVFQIDRVLLSHYVGLEAVGFYEIASRVASQARMLVVSVFTPMVPAASSLQATNEYEKVAGLYKRACKYMALAAIPLSVLIISLAHPFIRTWMGEGFEISAYTLQFLMAAYMFNLLTGPGSFILSGINMPEISMKSSLLAGFTNLVLCFSLVTMFGYKGIIAGIFVSLTTSGVYFIWMVHKSIQGLSWSIYPSTLIKPVVLSVCMGAIYLIIDRFFFVSGYGILCIAALLFYAVLISGLIKSNFFDEYDFLTMVRLNPLKSGK